jgi:RHS repeat-associated protein
VGFGGQYGYYTDPETGLVLCTHRYYDPGAGRWLTRDPISYKGGMNLYSYAGGNPINEIDPDGTNGLGDWLENLFDVKHPHMSDVHNLQMQYGMSYLDNDNNQKIAAAETQAWWAHELKRRQTNQRDLGFALNVITSPIGGGEVAGTKIAIESVDTGAVLGRIALTESKAAILKANKIAGDAFRDEIAAALRASGREVRTEVPIQTPFGIRRADIEVKDANGELLGYIETKVGKSRYLPDQRAKDAYIEKFLHYPVVLLRKE